MDLEELVAGAFVAGKDMNSREYCPPYWDSSLPLYERAIQEIEKIRSAVHWFPAFERELPPEAVYSSLISALGKARDDGALPAGLVHRLADLPENIRLVYFSGDPGELSSPRRIGLPPEGKPAGQVHVVVPFRARHSTLRLRNILACLHSVRSQSDANVKFYVTVVESDESPVHRDRLEPWVDNYVFQYQPGPFNKSASLNAGVACTKEDSDVLCLLDADIVVDREFVSRILCESQNASAFLPYEDAFYLDLESSSRVVDGLDADGADFVGTLSGCLLRRPPGGCVVVSSERFRSVGGFDPSFVGWGGEDRDFITRLERESPVPRTPHTLLHLMHERPEMANAAPRATHDPQAPGALA
ncbi:glycosyltransferase family 2 protein (plasmid) [Streptomyces clavuligerus]|nr:glycosyltransferase family A protein [Streptomyces clavuligerus]MBY6307087.1 glycosyltransferase family 2 protein [Streptomyces clavuligerus]QPJ97618.1 glycosyltransferase [Streptomyces clavuligerus]QPL67137.1 glycosyltransferase family 2 protein [Streptomyces clavuligerus]QPL73351.1 glycosyltransferase family 2 protein [Streptomyces clavuligerus]QPL79240.1 glycosyltransferase family 2 protein [Streptomyces clavuligerus]